MKELLELQFQNFIHEINLRQKAIVIVFFSILLLTGLLIFNQYGLSWDEGMQWKNNGYVNFNYVVHGDKDALLASTDKYHGPAFELTLVAIEKVFKLTDTRSVYLMRHLVNFMFFFVSVIFFYLAANKIFKNWKLALTGCVMYVLSPRIFAEAFYNSKDIITLAFFVISFYTLLLFHEKQTWKLAALHAMLCAYTIDIRITAIILPMLSVVYIFLQISAAVLYKNKLNMNFVVFILYFISLTGFTILFWPVLWEGPVFHFVQAFKEMSLYQWDSTVLYFGKYIVVGELPWHYLPLWILISTPVLYSVLFFTGLYDFVKTLFINPSMLLISEKNKVLLVLWFFTPILAVILLNSIVYDAWRHVFFIYGAFLFIALDGLKILFIQAAKFKNGKLFLGILLALSFISTFSNMVKMHPYQNVYFNFLAGNDMQKVKSNFEFDYWGLSNRAALEYILKSDTASVITVLAPHTPGVLNAQILPLNQRNRLRFTIVLNEADYYLGDYRAHKQDYILKNEVFHVNSGNAKLVSVFKLTEAEKNEKNLKP